ncbi:Na+/H+ antiporter NhaA [Maricaulis sp. CAU 1757]
MSAILARLNEFLRLESAAGLILIVAAALALIAANSPLAELRDGLLATPIAIEVGALAIDKPLTLWINDLLMAVFFLLVGLEIKREVLEGQLNSLDKSALPLVAALGGMVGPVLVYLAFNADTPATQSGWAIPAATDIAFALGILLLLGKRVPTALKVLLLAIAIIDDLGAILIIALFYTEQVALQPLALAVAASAMLIALNRGRVQSLPIYLLVGAVLWTCLLKSGVHATLAGVITALAVPLQSRDDASHSPLHALEHKLHPWVAFGVLPIFAFANAGVAFGGLTLGDLTAPVTLGIIAGLVIGKQFGVFGAMALAIRLRIARRPEGVSWLHLYGLSCLTGVGFTMSLFIGGLAFADPDLMERVRLGVLVGSALATGLAIGALMLAGRRSPARQRHRQNAEDSSKPLTA